MVYTVTLNPAIDYYANIDRLSLGKVNRTRSERLSPGGKGVNVSFVLNNLETPNIAFGFCGGHTGRLLTDLLREYGADCDFTDISDGTCNTTRINIKLSDGTEINGEGMQLNESHISILLDKLERLCNGDFLVLGGSIPAGLPDDVYYRIAMHAANRGVRTVIDTSGNALITAIKANPYLVKPNHIELGEIFGTKIETRADAALYAKKLQENGARNILVTLAADGAVLVCEDGTCYEMDAPAGVVRNSVGAGDAAVAGFIASMVMYDDAYSAMKLSVAAGSASAFCDGIPTGAEIKRYCMGDCR